MTNNEAIAMIRNLHHDALIGEYRTALRMAIKALEKCESWIPVTERQPNHELAIVQFSDGDFSLLQFPTAYRWKDIVAWFPLPEPYKEGQEC